MSHSPASAGPDRTLVRHLAATLAYRAGKAVRAAPPDFASFRAGLTSRTPVQIVSHMGDLFDWALSMAQGKTMWRDAEPSSWDAEVNRFFTALTEFDSYLASEATIEQRIIEKLIQGPLADALTHTGQLTFLRRLAGAPVRGESYAQADIAVGRTGIEQAPPRKEFG